MPDAPTPKKRDQEGRKGAGRAGRAGTVALVGRPNVGKSTLLNALVGEHLAITSRHPQTTRVTMRGILSEEDAQFVIVDTPGIHRPRTKLGTRMNAVAEEAARDCDVVVFMTDVGETPREQMSAEDLAVLAAIPESVPVVLAINKIDRVKDRSKLLPLLEGYAKARNFAAIVPISALKNKGPERILAEVRKLLPKAEAMYPEDELSDKPTRFFVAEFVREQILSRTHQEVPHGVAVVVDAFDEGPRVPRISISVHVDKESHKAIVLGAKGALIKQIGTQARARVETLIGKQVHLEIHVKATPRWYEDESKLSELGFGDRANEVEER